MSGTREKKTYKWKAGSIFVAKDNLTGCFFARGTVAAPSYRKRFFPIPGTVLIILNDPEGEPDVASCAEVCALTSDGALIFFEEMRIASNARLLAQ